MISKNRCFVLFSTLFLLLFVSSGFCQPPSKPVPINQQILVVEEKEDVSDEIKSVTKELLTSDADQQKVIHLRFLLKKRNQLVSLEASPEAIKTVDKKILDLLDNVDDETYGKLLQALNEIWDAEDDYYDTIVYIYDDLDYYKPWLGPRYDFFIKRRLFLTTYHPKFLEWRKGRHPRPWHPKHPLNKPPKYQHKPTDKKLPPKPGINKPDKPKPPTKPERTTPRKPGGRSRAR